MKKITIISLILILCFALSGCDSTTESEKTTTGSQVVNEVYVYYPEESEVVVSKDGYQLKQPDSIVASVEEVMSVSLEYYDGKLENYSYMVDNDNEVTLSITIAEDCSREYSLLTMASISDTLFQLELVESVKITLVTSEGEMVDSKLILRNTFYHYDSGRVPETKRVTFYKATSDKTALEALSGYVMLDDNVSVVENIVIELEKIDAIPKGTRINSLTINDGICYLDLSSEFEGTVPGVKNDIVVYSLVNSVASLSNIDKVMITIDSEIIDSYRGSVSLREPLSFNKNIIR